MRSDAQFASGAKRGVWRRGRLLLVLCAAVVVLAWLAVAHFLHNRDERMAVEIISSWAMYTADQKADEAAVCWIRQTARVAPLYDSLPKAEQMSPYSILLDKYMGESRYNEAFEMMQALWSLKPGMVPPEVIYLAVLAGKKDWLVWFAQAPDMTEDVAQYVQASVSLASGDRERVLTLADDTARRAQGDGRNLTNYEAWLLLLAARTLEECQDFDRAWNIMLKVDPLLNQMTAEGGMKLHIVVLEATIADRAGQRAVALELSRMILDGIGKSVSWSEARTRMAVIAERGGVNGR